MWNITFNLLTIRSLERQNSTLCSTLCLSEAYCTQKKQESINQRDKCSDPKHPWTFQTIYSIRSAMEPQTEKLLNNEMCCFGSSTLLSQKLSIRL